MYHIRHHWQIRPLVWNMLGTSERVLELVGGVRKTGAAIAYLKK